jgi:hypothetical protein
VFPDFIASGFELRFHESHDVGALLQKRRQRRQNQTERDERHVDRHHADRVRHIIAGECARIDTLANDDAGVSAQPPIQLAASDVERDDARGAALQQHVGKAAGRRAHIQRAPPGRIDVEHVERARELDAAPSDIRVIGRDQRDARVGRDRRTRLVDHLPIDRDLAGKNQRARPFP